MRHSPHLPASPRTYPTYGDRVGTGVVRRFVRIQNVITIPPFMPPFWDAEGFRSAVERIQRIDYERICLAHFGCLEGDGARDFVGHAVHTYEA